MGLRTDGRIDDRSFWISYVSSVSIPLAVPYVYPRMVPIHDLDSKVIFTTIAYSMLCSVLTIFLKPLLTICHLQGEDGSLIPPFLPLSSEHVSDEGIYLLENGEDALIYIGSAVDSNILQQLFGFSSVDEVPTQVVQSYSLENIYPNEYYLYQFGVVGCILAYSHG